MTAIGIQIAPRTARMPAASSQSVSVSVRSFGKEKAPQGVGSRTGLGIPAGLSPSDLLRGWPNFNTVRNDSAHILNQEPCLLSSPPFRAQLFRYANLFILD